jgi:hypothetical protein
MTAPWKPFVVKAAALVVCLWSFGLPAAAAPPPPLKLPPTDVSGITISPVTAAPKVVATFPAAGQALAGGVLILTITFDQKMTPDGFDVTSAAGGEAPPCLKRPRLLDDGKTFALLCTTDGGKTYALAFNAGSQGGFANIGDRRAEPATLSFTTTAASGGPRSIAEAMKQASLTTFDVPIQETPGLHAQPGP